MLAQAPAPAGRGAAATGGRRGGERAAAHPDGDEPAVTSARAIMTSAAVQAAGPVMWCAMLKAAMAGPGGP
jgi:hypothetical protein